MTIISGPHCLALSLILYENELGRRTARRSKEGKRHAADCLCIRSRDADLRGIQAGPADVTPVYSHHSRHQYIVIPLTRRYAYRPYWWPQGQYHWSPFGLERWGYWCEGAGAHRLSC